jgi:Ni/Fe-hydrogenase subunit HybB-like protein
MATAFVGLLFLLLYASFIKKDDALYDKVLAWTVVLAIPVTLYTAGLMAQSTARELWQMPTEAAQMIFAAMLAGSAVMLLIGKNLSFEVRRDIGIILAFSALGAFILYMSELIFGPMKAEEVGAVLEFVKGHGEYAAMFWIGQVFAFIAPFILVVLAILNRSSSILNLASISALAGLWVSKHVWLVIPQLLNMS